MMRILAFDPSLSCIGWAWYDTAEDMVLAGGIIKPTGETLDDKLASAEWDLMVVAESNPADATAVEIPVYHKNAKTLRDLAQLCGALRLSIRHHTKQVIEILPQERLTGLGLPARMRRDNAKAAVLRNVNLRFNLDLQPKDNDIADAIAVALAAAQKLKEEEWASEGDG